VGTDTNISQVFQSKGTGAIDLVAGSSGVKISNGGTVTAINIYCYLCTYSTLPSNPVSTTGGTGTGLTLNVTFAVSAGFTISNAGSGYVE
jgi:hypothetical protein